MRFAYGLFFKLIVMVVTENPLRDKIIITSCENSFGQPEMTIRGPDFVLNEKNSQSEHTEQVVEKTINYKDLTMITNDKSEFFLMKIYNYLHI